MAGSMPRAYSDTSAPVREPAAPAARLRVRTDDVESTVIHGRTRCVDSPVGADLAAGVVPGVAGVGAAGAAVFPHHLRRVPRRAQRPARPRPARPPPGGPDPRPLRRLVHF